MTDIQPSMVSSAAQWGYRWLKMGGIECDHLGKYTFPPFSKEARTSFRCHVFLLLVTITRASLPIRQDWQGGRVARWQGGKVMGWQDSGVVTGTFGGLSKPPKQMSRISDITMFHPMAAHMPSFPLIPLPCPPGLPQGHLNP